MFKNYIVIAWRSLLRNKLHSAINIFGLAIGISACLVIFLIVNFELSFDKFHRDGDRIYRVYSQFSGDYKGYNRGVPAPMSVASKHELTGLESMTGFHTYHASVYILDNKNQRKDFEGQRSIAIVDSDFFDVFNAYQWVAGSPSTSLVKPFQVVLTESKAKTYFGTEEPQKYLGREIHYRDSLILTVSGIVMDIQPHTDLYFTDFISYSTIQDSWLKKNIRLEDWESTNSSSQFFVKLAPGTRPEKLEASLDALAKAHKKKNPDPTWIVNYHVQPLADVHFNSALGIFDNRGEVAHLPTLQILVIVALLLLAIAAVNFINLETAQAVRRAKEVGLRKVMGSSRGKLILHFLMQSVFLTALAIILSLPISEFAIRFFEGFIPSGVKLSFADPFTVGFLVIALVVVSFLSGFYPAFSLSSFLPALALKNQMSANSHQTRSGFVRKGLIVFQFTVAQAMIVATLVVGWQIRYLLSKDLGFSKEAIIYFETPWRLPHSKTLALKNELDRLPEIKSMTLCSDAPASQNFNSNTLKYNNGKEELHHNVYRKFGDTSFLSVFNLKLIAGRNIHRTDSADEYIINETYMKMLGFKRPEDAIDKFLIDDAKRTPIVGVVKDFNFQSLHATIEPVVIADEEYNFNCLAIKLENVSGTADIKKLTDKIEQAWKRVYPDEKFNYYFLDEAIAKFYVKEERTAKLVDTATVIAVLISCMGLFGLASFTSTQRTKEIGIRKVLGASVGNIISLLSKDFLWLVAIAFAVAAPLSYYAAVGWLAEFAYRISIGWQVFVWTMVASVAIVMLSVSYQAIKAAMTDPVKSLRYE